MSGTARAPPSPPIFQTAPPSKKQRASGTPNRDRMTSIETDQAVVRRRAELERLKQMSGGGMTTSGSGRSYTSAEALLAQARSQLPSAGGPPTSSQRGGPPTSSRAPLPSALRSAPGAATRAPPVPRPGQPVPRARGSVPQAPSSGPTQLPTNPPDALKASPATTTAVPRKLDGAFANGSDKSPVTAETETSDAKPTPPPPARERSRSAPPARPPAENPPPGPAVPGTDAKRDYVGRPAPVSGSDIPKTTEDIISTTTESYEARELRIQKDMLRLEHDKMQALDKVTRLQAEISALRHSKRGDIEILTAVVQKADIEGESAALQWVRERAGGDKQKVAFMSPMAPILSSPISGITPASIGVMSPPASRKRVSTPYPKRKNAHDQLDREFAKQAVECVPPEYSSDLATFVIRRPFGLASENELWNVGGFMDPMSYQEKADVNQVPTVEVAALVKADNSLLVLHGDGVVRHRQTPESDWKEFGDVTKGNITLGSVLYIDSSANEKEYSLDEILDGALSVREHYCSSILSTAAGFRVREESHPPMPVIPGSAPPQLIAEAAATPKKPMRDVSVATDDVPIPQASGPPPSGQAEKKMAPPPPPDDSPDVLSVFIMMFFSSIFGIIWTIFIRIPLRIISFVFYMAMSIIVLAFIWMYLADDGGAYDMGAMVTTMYNRPGVV